MYQLTEKHIVGEVYEIVANYDLMSIVMICLGTSKDERYTGLLKLLDVWMSGLYIDEKGAVLKFDLIIDLPVRFCKMFFPGLAMDESLRRFVRYMWWKSPEEALRYSDRIIARVMDRGTTEDVFALIESVGRDRMRHVLMNAEAGEFDAKSWTYWNYMLTDISLGQVPPMPERRFQ